MKMILLIATIIFASLSANAWTTEHTTTNGVIAITNREPTAAWTPSAIHFVFASGKTGTVTVARIAHNVRVPLASHSFTNVAVVSWIPDIDATIRPAEVLALTSTVANCNVQIDRKAAQ